MVQQPPSCGGKVPSPSQRPAQARKGLRCADAALSAWGPVSSCSWMDGAAWSLFCNPGVAPQWEARGAQTRLGTSPRAASTSGWPLVLQMPHSPRTGEEDVKGILVPFLYLLLTSSPHLDLELSEMGCCISQRAGVSKTLFCQGSWDDKMRFNPCKSQTPDF